MRFWFWWNAGFCAFNLWLAFGFASQGQRVLPVLLGSIGIGNGIAAVILVGRAWASWKRGG